ncbi:two-component system sensor histidine kinase NtrB [Teredinibacter waterburyi]|jgi:PAS domain S-box|uniref:two-component system sensor histidine kinase NtrB n=1 Tax=Teredinibacter waterburyi TaxID=1500538 RepID=UPI00165F22BC|nr:ATP-binding protein [Teredinibacter waterburyi]
MYSSILATVHSWPLSSVITLLLLAAVIVALLISLHLNLQHVKQKTRAKVQALSIASADTQIEHKREIAEHQAAEQLLQQTQEYLHCMINSMPNILIGITPTGCITHWNTAAERATNVMHSEALGNLLPDIYPQLPITLEEIQQIIKDYVPFEKKNIKQGSGSQATYLNVTLYPLMSEDLSGAVVLAEDVTQRVRMENMLVQNEKMMSLGELAAGVAHEINNPLAAILNNTQNIERRTSPTLQANHQTAESLGIDIQRVAAYMEQREILTFVASIREAGERAAKIVTNLLEFSRGNDRSHAEICLQELVEHALQLATNTFELGTADGIEMPTIRKIYDSDVPAVRCSASEIQQVLLNLLRNAAQALQSEEYGVPLEPEICIHISRSDEYAIIEVSDNGPGITEPVIKHIFEPFYTTKDVGVGTGLGLSVSYFIITEHHGGVIEVDSRPGEGTTFTIKLPLHGELR